MSFLPRLRRVAEHTGRFVRGVVSEAPRFLRHVDQHVLQPLSRAARVADHVSKTHSLGPAQAAVETFTKGMQSYDTLRQSVLGAAAAQDAIHGSLAKKRPRAQLE